MSKEIFYYEESPYHPGFYLIRAKHDDFLLQNTEGSYAIIAARLMNMKYAEYLRFCRDVLGATIIGKKNMYPLAYFQKGENLFQFVRLLNGRANYVLFERSHPDFEKHKYEVEKYNYENRA